MLCNWCHKEILAGQELKSQGSGTGSFSLYEGTGGGSYQFQEGGYYHRRCYYDKLLWELKSERDNLWKGWFWLWILLLPVLIIILIMKVIRKNKLDKMIRDLEQRIGD